MICVPLILFLMQLISPYFSVSGEYVHAEVIYSIMLLIVFSAAYHMVRPSKASGFSYAWLELISHRVFIAKLLLQTPQQKVK